MKEGEVLARPEDTWTGERRGRARVGSRLLLRS